jgi:hypothetical protein
MKPTVQTKVFPLSDGPRRRGRFLFTHVLAGQLVSPRGAALGEPSYTLLGRYIWNTGRTYRPNGARECARRRRQIELGHIKPTPSYVDSIDYGDGTWDHKEFVA